MNVSIDEMLAFVFTLSAILLAYFVLVGKKKKKRRRAVVLTSVDVRVTTHLTKKDEAESFALELPLPMSPGTLKLLLCSELGMSDAIVPYLALTHGGLKWPDTRDVTAALARGLSVHVRSAAKALPPLTGSTDLTAAKAPQPTGEDAFPSLVPGRAKKLEPLPLPAGFKFSKAVRVANTGGG